MRGGQEKGELVSMARPVQEILPPCKTLGQREGLRTLIAPKTAPAMGRQSITGFTVSRVSPTDFRMSFMAATDLAHYPRHLPASQLEPRTRLTALVLRYGSPTLQTHGVAGGRAR
jgi:hypothetical protein